MTLQSTFSTASLPGTCSRSTRRSWSRASRAGSACRIAPRIGSPVSRRRHRAGASPPCVRSSSTARPVDDAFRHTMETCVQCRGCEVACPSGVPFGHLMEGARESLARSTTAPRGRPASRRRVAGVRRRVAPALAVARAHVADMARAAPAARAAAVRPAEALAAFVARAPERCRAARRVSVHGLRHGRVAARRPPCCAQRDERSRRACPGSRDPGGDCCGALHVHAGRVQHARRLARRVIASMPGDAPVVVDSAGCGAAMKDYGRLLGTPAASAFSARVLDFSEWLAAQPPLALRDTRREAVVQDPCHLRHVQKAHGAVRTVLAPAYRLRETADDGLCCGAGGAYAALEPELSTDIRLRKVEAIRRAAERRRPARGLRQPGVRHAPRRGRSERSSPGRTARRRTRGATPWLTPSRSSSGCARSKRSCATSPTSGCVRRRRRRRRRARRREAGPASTPRHRARHQRARRTHRIGVSTPHHGSVTADR